MSAASNGYLCELPEQGRGIVSADKGFTNEHRGYSEQAGVPGSPQPNAAPSEVPPAGPAQGDGRSAQQT